MIAAKPEPVPESTVRASLREFIQSQILRLPDLQLSDNDALITGGLLDSFAVAQLATFVEQTFGVRLSDAELTAENMDTVERLASRVVRGL